MSHSYKNATSILGLGPISLAFLHLCPRELASGKLPR